MLYLGERALNSIVYIPFQTFDANGASVAISSIGTSSIKVYKNGSTVQRTSNAGYALLDADGVNFDGFVGLHGVSIDLSNNSDSGFYAAGNFYKVAIGSCVVASQTVNFWPACFDIRSALATVGEIADGVWDEAQSGHTGAGTFGRYLDAQVASVASICTTIASSLGTPSNLGSGATVAANLSDIEGQTDDIGAAGVGLTGLSTTIASAVWNATVSSYITAGSTGERVERLDIIASGGAGELTSARATNLTNLDATVSTRSTVTTAQVNAEMLDVLATDTFAEPGQEAPSATTTLAKKIGYLYKFLRNKITQDATTLKIYADDGTTVDQKSSVSDNGDTFTRGEIGTGP